jgi:glutaminyl-peptide cyclotransferase
MAPGQLLASDGSELLSTLDSASLRTLAAVRVLDGAAPVTRLNELELIDGQLWANVWLTDCVARIDPSSGVVLGWVLLHGLRGAENAGDVLNGIAWDAAARRVLVTVRHAWSQGSERQSGRAASSHRHNRDRRANIGRNCFTSRWCPATCRWQRRASAAYGAERCAR